MPPAITKAFGIPLPLSGRLKSELTTARTVLRATAQRSGSAVIVLSVGEVDASNETAWQHLLSEVVARADAPGRVVVDVRDVDFNGSSGFAPLAKTAKQCRRRGISLCLVSQQPSVARTVAMCGLRWMLPIHPTIESALSQADAVSNGGRSWAR